MPQPNTVSCQLGLSQLRMARTRCSEQSSRVILQYCICSDPSLHQHVKYVHAAFRVGLVRCIRRYSLAHSSRAACIRTSNMNVHRGRGVSACTLGVSQDTGQSFVSGCAALGNWQPCHACCQHLRCAVLCAVVHHLSVLKRLSTWTASTTTGASN